MKLLKNIELPSGFEDAEGYSVDIDEDAMLFYEAYVFTTDLDFKNAVAKLELLFKQHYGSPQKTISGNNEKVASCVLTCTLEAQEIIAQITDFGGNCGGYLRVESKWCWGWH